jgi:hypothetical protein
MKTIPFTITILFILTFLSCKKETVNQTIIPIPNGDFELWDNMPYLYDWKTNSCPLCMPAYEPYIVRKVTDIANGQFAAKFIYNNFFSSYAVNKFSIALHPSLLTGYIKSTIANGDTAFIHIELFSGGNIVDNGNFYETMSHPNYRKIEIAISQDARNVDSALIKIIGGKKQGTELFVDNLLLLKNNN